MELTKHPRNIDFIWPKVARPPTLISLEQQTDWNEKGFFLLKDVIDKTMLAAVESEIDPLEAIREQKLREAGGRFGISQADGITFTSHVVLHSNAARELVTSKPLAQLCADLLGSNVRLYWDQAVYKKPEHPAEFPWHQDNGYTFVEPQTYLTCWIPLNTASVANGSPWVVPGVHLQGTLKHRWTDLGFECFQAHKNAEVLEAEPGDVIVFSSLTPHLTGPNLTDGVRKAYIVQYAQDGSQMFPRDVEGPVDQNDPERQFSILKDGVRCDASVLNQA